MSGRISQLWSNEESRRSLVAAIRGWNSALSQGWPEQLRAAGLLKQVFRRCDSTPASSAPETETPTQTIDRLLDFPSHRLAVYGSLAPGKKNHHVMAGAHGTWRQAVLRGSLRNEGWGAGEGFPGFLWDGSSTPVAAQVFSSPDLPQHWQRLDEFEGREYQRILIPVEVLPQQAKTGPPPRQTKSAPVGDPRLAGDSLIQGREIEICNVYALAG